MTTTTALLSGVTFNEFLGKPLGSDQDYDGDGDVDTGDRYIEFYNTSSTAVDLEGWQLYLDGRTLMHTFDSGDVIEAEGFFTLVSNFDGSTTITDVGGTASFSDNALVISNSNSFILYNPDEDAFIYVGGVNNGSLESSDLSAFSAIVSATATQVGSSEFLSESFTDGLSASRVSDGDATWVSQDVTPGRTNIPDLIVDTADDNDDGDVSDGNLSLREAVQLAVDGQTIRFDDDVFTGGANSVIRLTEGQIQIDAEVTIDGSTGTDIVITGDATGDDTTFTGTYITDLSASSGALSDNTRVLYISSSGAGTTLEGLTITGGRTTTDFADGGGVRANGALTIVDSTISGNQTTGDEANGAGIASFADLTLTNSTVSENSTTGGLSRGGGVSIEGTVAVDRQVTITNSTISDNGTTGAAVNGYGPAGGGLFGLRADISLVNGTVSGNSTTGANARGGGIYIEDGSLSVTGGTISGNSTSGSGANGGGIRAQSNATVTLTNSVVLGNVAANGSGDDLSGSASYTGGNIVGGDVFSGSTDIGDATASEVFAETEDNNGVDAGVLADNGGDVATIALLEDTDNPALDVGDLPSGVTTDAEGNSRAVDQTNIDNGGTVDLGAVEVQGDIEEKSLVVTTVEDIVDATDQLTSLREAIAFANSATDADGDGNDVDTVSFDSSVFTGGADSLIRLLDGRILITDAVNIDGSMGTDIVITGDAGNDDILVTGTYITDVAASTGSLYDNGRIFNITDADAATTINGLTLTGGYTYSSNIDGGAIRSLADLTITDTVIQGNGTRGNSSEGGGIFSTGDLTVTGSTVTENLTVGTDAQGGGIYSGGDLTLSDSTVSDNATQGDDSDGGGIFAAGAITISDSTISGNSTSGTSARGGGIYGADTTTLTDSTVSGNTTSGSSAEGGGIYGLGAITVTGSTVSGNTTAGTNADGGGISGASTVDLTGSTVSDNSVADVGAAGGGVFATYALTLTNATISGNSTGGFIQASGGGVYGVRDVTLVNSTVSGNSIRGSLSETGGVFSLGLDGTGLTLTNSLVLGNYAQNTAGADVYLNTSFGGSLSYTGGNIVGDEFSIDGTVDTTGITAAEVFAATTDNNGVDAGVLADNGGTVETIALLEDAANPALDVGDLPSGLTTDANGGVREVDLSDVDNGGTVDIGAVEVQLSEAETESLTVTTTRDVVEAFDGMTSLREAIGFINDGTFDEGSTITFDESLSGSTLFRDQDLDELRLTTTMTIQGDIDGDGIGDITISADTSDGSDDAEDRVINITSGTATLNGLTIANGNQGGSSIFGVGGGIRVQSGAELELSNSSISNNTAGGDGGGLYVGGTATLTNVTVDNNASSGNGGGISNDTGTATLINTTVYGNSASNGGGLANKGTTDVTNSTFTGNYASGDSGGIRTFSTGVTLTNTLVLGNAAGSYAEVSGTYTDGGGNMIGDGSITATEVFATTVTLNSVEAGALADNGGPVQTAALLAVTTNPALDVGDLPSGVTTDATGNTREVDQTDVDNGGAVDAGAVELQTEAETPVLVVTTADDVVDDTDDVLSLREAIILANSASDASGDGTDVDTITFDATVFTGGTDAIIRLTQGDLDVTDKTVIDGDLDDDGVADVTISGDANADDLDADGLTLANGGTGITDVGQSDATRSDNSRIFDISAQTTLNGLYLTGGYTNASGSEGGGVRSSANLTITDSIISGNSTAGRLSSGGGVYTIKDLTISASLITGNRTEGDRAKGGGTFSFGETTITDSVVTGNSTAGELANGGGILSFGTATITDSVISGNSTSGYRAGGGGLGSNDAVYLTRSSVSENTTTGIKSYGGGILHQPAAEDVVLVDSIISGNLTTGTGSKGGGIFTDNELYALNSTISDNMTIGANASGGGLSVDVRAQFVNITISGNTTTGDGANGGGVFGNAFNGADLHFINSTISGNAALGTGGDGGGFHVGYITQGGETDLFLSNSLVLGNIAVDGANDNIASADGFNRSGGNIIGDTFSVGGTTQTTGIASSDVFATTEEVTDADGVGLGVYAGVLADNGGSVQTIALLASLDNPAIDAGADGRLVEATVGRDLNGDGDTDDTLSTDARGFTRAVDVDAIANNGSNTVDLGAFETQTEATIGPDVFEGTTSDAIFDTGEGNDLGLPGAGAETITGDADSDTLDFSTATERAIVYLDGTPGIGGVAAGDVYVDFENVIGSDFNDRLFGDDADNWLDGGDGRDVLSGGAGDDTLEGGAGTDLLVGGTGTNTLTGGADRDYFYIEDGEATYIITDWDASEDLLLFRKAGVGAFAELEIEQDGADVVLTAVGGSSWTVIAQDHLTTDFDDVDQFIFQV